ncbi:MAG: DUF3592 domain-containing protein [Anaerolineae bacterium]|nr:DUF3592 domain-containing protein [Anaerolineae bacterium]
MNNDFLLSLLLFGGIVAAFVIISTISTAITVLPLGLLGFYVYRRSKQAGAIRQASQSWPSVSGKVLESRFGFRLGSRVTVVPYVLYEYNVGGRLYQAQQIRAGDNIFLVRNGQYASRVIDQYPEGALVTVYYNPDSPAEAALER